MAGHVILTKCPIVKIENVALDTYLDVSDFGDYKIITFQRQLIWLRSAEAKVLLMRKGKVLRSLSSFNDYCGYLTSASAAIEAAKRFAVTEEVWPESEVQVVVSLDIVDEPSIFDLSSRGMDYMEMSTSQIAYRPLDETEGRQFAYSGTEDMDAWVRGDSESKFRLHSQVPWVQRTALVSGHALWDSSKHLSNPAADIEIAATIEQYRAEVVNYTHELIAQREALRTKMQERRAHMSAR